MLLIEVLVILIESIFLIDVLSDEDEYYTSKALSLMKFVGVIIIANTVSMFLGFILLFVI